MTVIVDPLTSFLLKEGGKLVIKEVKFLCGVKKEVEEMQIELQWMQSFLEDADRLDVHAQTSVDRKWVSEIKEQSLDAEDVVDSYLENEGAFEFKAMRMLQIVKVDEVKIALRNEGGILNRIKRYARSGIDTHEVGTKIEALKSRLATLKTRLDTYGKIRDLKVGEASSSSSGGQAQMWQRQAYGHVLDRNIVGLGGKIEEVIGLLLREEEPCRVVSIYGMGGLGKTTLAKKVYHNDKIKSRFDKFVWMCVSQHFKPRDVWETIYIELTSPSPEQRKEIARLKDDEIASKLYQLVQKDHKCFIVLDDIWSIEAWNSLLAAFPMEESATSSKILITTRIKELAEHVDRRGSYGGLELLSLNQCWELLQKIAFAGRDDMKDNESMKNLGEDMIERCGRLPLAIVVLAGILATKKTLRDWDIVRKNIKTYLKKGNGGQCLGVDDVLSFSYYDLPRELKSCILYLSQFPEDHEIETSRLLKMWMAEGLVCIQNEGDEEEMMEDVAERYLNELVGRCMIQVGKEGSTGRIKTCRMHDLMRNMCLSKAKEDFFIENFIPNYSAQGVGRVRRLSLFSDEESPDLIKYSRYRQLRSLIVSRDDHQWPRSFGIEILPMITNLKLLKMLVLEAISIYDETALKEIGNLIHLKYLSLRGSLVWNFPPMEKLRCLETLDLRVVWMITMGRLFLNTNAIWKMQNLRHVYFPRRWERSTTSGKKRHIGNIMKNEKVQTLMNFPPLYCPLSEVVTFPNVRKLQIIFRPDVDNHMGKPEFSRLSSLSLLADGVASDQKFDLQVILMGCPNLYKLRIKGGLVNIPPEVNPLAAKLTKLILIGSEIEDPKHIETNLGKLPNLKILHLEWDAFKGRELCFQPGSFPQLKSLLLERLHNLEEWRVDQGAMPILQSLTIIDCMKLKMVPEGLRFIDSLKELYIKGMPEDFKERVKEGGPDFHKVKHIPTIIIQREFE